MNHPQLRTLNSLLLIFVCFALTPLRAQSVSPDLYSGLRWRMIGPFRGGRAVATAGVPGDANTFYFGAVDGGIWKTTNAGVTWTPIFDGQPVASIGTIAAAPSDPKTIYVGTGESDIRSDLASGDGVYRSTDGGETWQNIGLRETRQISRIVIDPQNANIVYVGALGHAYGPNPERGVFKSTDAGAHWTKVLDQGPETGIADLAIATDHPNILFAATWHTHRPAWSTYAPIDAPGSGIFRSEDGGNTWSRLASGLPEGNWGRPAVAASPDGKRVYALIDDGNKSGLYRSDDGGSTWTLKNSDARLTSRAWYFGNITVDPQNPDVFYVPNVALYRSEDGGQTISIVRGAPGGDDYHQLWVDPKDSARMILATDQGTSISIDRGATWSSWYNQPTAQLYHVVTDDRFPYTVYGAQQDSGSASVLSRTDHGQITPRDWSPVDGSESGYIAPDPKEPNVLYFSGTYGSVSRFDLRTSFSQDITPWPLPTFGVDIAQRKYRDPWTPVLVFSPRDKTSLYLGTQFVMKTTDGGLHWQTISPDLTGAQSGAVDQISRTGHAETQGPPTVQDATQRGYGVVYTIAPSPLDANLIWAGSDTGLIHVTRDGGKTWKNVTPKVLGDWSKISLIEASHFNAAEAYAAVDRHRLDDQTPYLYRTRDYGQTWHPITDGLHAPAFLNAVREDPTHKGLLFAGAEFGVYVSFDDGDHWQTLQLNLPVTSIRDLDIHDNDLIIATHGRSFWILDDITPLRQAADVRQGGTCLYRPATAVRVDNAGFMGTPLPPEEPTAANPPNGAIVDYFLAKPADQVKLEIFDAQHTLVRSFSSEVPRASHRPPVPIAERWLSKPQPLDKSAGMHRFVWNLAWGVEIPTSGDEEEEYFAPHGPRAAPGDYEVRLTVDGQTLTQPLHITMDPRSTATPQDLAQQVKLGRQIFGEALESRRVLSAIRAVQKQLSDLQPKLQQNPDLKASADVASDELKAIVSGPTREMGLDQASTGLSAALRVVESSDRAVPAQALEVYRESSAAAKEALAKWNDFKSKRLPELNHRLEGASLHPLAVAQIEKEIEESEAQ